MTADRDDLAAILAKHRWISGAFRWTGCSCDPLWWKGYESAGKTEDMYFAHVAQMVLESDWLRRVKTQTIDELKSFLPEWNYPDHVVAAISLELKERLEVMKDVE